MDLTEIKSRHGIGEETTGFIVEEADGSLERFERGGQVLYKLSKGKMRSPGHPAGNHMYSNVMPLFQLFNSQRRVPVFIKKRDGSYIYAGKYEYDMLRKCVSNEGFSYFEFRMFRRELGDSAAAAAAAAAVGGCSNLVSIL